jgi:hypothetical protein
MANITPQLKVAPVEEHWQNLHCFQTGGAHLSTMWGVSINYSVLFWLGTSQTMAIWQCVGHAHF